MTYRGHVRNGLIVLDEPTDLPEGTAVEVHPAEETEPQQKPDPEEKVPTLYERLTPFIGMVKDAPPDASVNYEHHLYGSPKQK